MIRLDSRAGSGELEHLFKPYGITVQKTHLDFGDMDWIGKGPNGECAVVVERKKIDDLLQSMQSRRLSGHQLPGMAEQYDYAYLIVEGIWKPGDEGELMVSAWGRWISRSIHTRAINNYLMGLSLRAGLIVWRTMSEKETVSFVVDQYRMWTEKGWEQHKCHDQVYAPAQAQGRAGRLVSFKPRQVSLCEKIAMQLPGVDRRAKNVAEYFRHNVYAMVGAGVNDWVKVPGVGPTTARKIVEQLR